MGFYFNKQVGGLLLALEKHIDAVKSNSLFQGTDFKLASSHHPFNDKVARECGFTSLSIRIVEVCSNFQPLGTFSVVLCHLLNHSFLIIFIVNHLLLIVRMSNGFTEWEFHGVWSLSRLCSDGIFIYMFFTTFTMFY